MSRRTWGRRSQQLTPLIFHCKTETRWANSVNPEEIMPGSAFELADPLDGSGRLA